MELPSVSENENREEDGSETVTMVDLLMEETELEEHVNAVLGGADDKSCTYSKGYVTRQPLYACATCNPKEGGNLAGVCLGCSFSCHEGHDLIELYTKRDFRCDCGNSLFQNKCNLEPEKDSVNVNNKYNKNFRGLYCTCNRPYPDPEDTVTDEMMQCILCEDWYHGRHLGVSDVKNFDEVICLDCMKNHPFLWKYTGLCVRDVKTESVNDSPNFSVSDVMTKVEDCEASKTEKNEKEEDVCNLEKYKSPEIQCGSTFWPDGWRKHLCRCAACLKMYNEKKIEFLLNENDTVEHYEKENRKNSKETEYEKGLKALSSLDRVKQIEVIEGFQHMRTELFSYLQKFEENKKVVRKEDIWEFFNQMSSRKRQKLEIQHFCR